MNPIAADMLDCWIKVRRRRMIDAKVAQKQLELLNEEVVKLVNIRSKMEAQDSSKKDSEKDWEDEQEVEQEDEQEKQYIMHGKVVSHTDVHNMVHFAATQNSFEDESIVQHTHKTASLIKSGNVKFAKKLLAENEFVSGRLGNQSHVKTRWA